MARCVSSGPRAPVGRADVPVACACSSPPYRQILSRLPGHEGESTWPPGGALYTAHGQSSAGGAAAPTSKQ